MLIKTIHTIEIHSKKADVFKFFCDISNDYLWRKEINRTLLHGKLQAGVIAYEYSRLSKRKPDNLLQLQCKEFDAGNRVVYESVKNAAFWLKTERQVEAISAMHTKVIYSLEFDTAIVQFGLGFPLPKFLIAAKANIDMKKYLQKLKQVIEAG